MSQTCLIITGAPQCHIPPSAQGADYIIACDQGYGHAVSAGIVPDLVVGDFDSWPGPIAAGIEVRRADPVKDETDTFLAMEAAIEKGYKNLIICGAFGGRIDHELANISLCGYAAEKGIHCTLVDQNHQIFAFQNGTRRISRGRWTKISIFAMDRIVRGVTLSGLRYPLEEAELTNTFPLGVSNEFAADKAVVSVKEGMLLVVLSDLSF